MSDAGSDSVVVRRVIMDFLKITSERETSNHG